MKVTIINSEGMEFYFDSCAAARPFIKKDKYKDFSIKNGSRVYDDRKRDVGDWGGSVFSDEYGDLL